MKDGAIIRRSKRGKTTTFRIVLSGEAALQAIVRIADELRKEPQGGQAATAPAGNLPSAIDDTHRVETPRNKD